MAEIALVFDLELLEDLHAGTGVGRLGQIDDTHARRQDGRPAVGSSALRGLLREAAEDWFLSRGLPQGHEERLRLDRLLGKRGEEGGQAVVRALEAVGVPPAGDWFIVWAATAREVHGRRPQEQTLCFLEFARAGLTFRGEIRLPGGVAREDVAFLTACLRRVTSLGGRKTRGWGQVQLTRCCECRLEPPPGGTLLGGLAGRPDAAPVCLRLLLHNLEPLNLARTAFAGNLIHATSFIPGSALRGAVLHWLNRQKRKDLAERLVRNMWASNAYVVDGSAASACEVIPLPLSLKEPKGGQPGADAGADDAPWWARAEGTDRSLGRREERDFVAQPRVKSEEPGVDYKRIKTEEYMFRLRGEPHWRRLRPKMGVLLRNRVPTDRLDPGVRADEQMPGYQADGFFSEQVLWEGQTFLAELTFADAASARLFADAAAHLLEGAEENRSWLRIGRKGRPVVVRDAAWFDPAPAPPAPDDRLTLTLTLTSDLIARTPWLTFRTALDLEALVDLLRRAGETPPGIEGLKRIHAISEPVEVYGFNSATGLPRCPALAIRRGSVLHVEANSAEGMENLRLLREAMRRVQDRGRGLGERTADGFGRFVLDLDVHDPKYWQATLDKVQEPTEKVEVERLEGVLKRVKDFMESMKRQKEKVSDPRGKDGPGVSQWQWLRHGARVARGAEDIARLLGQLKGRAEQLAGRAKWAVVARDLEAAASAFAHWEDRRDFLDLVAQHAVASIRDERRGGG